MSPPKMTENWLERWTFGRVFEISYSHDQLVGHISHEFTPNPQYKKQKNMLKLSPELHDKFSSQVIASLQDKGYSTVADFLRADSNALQKITNIGE